MRLHTHRAGYGQGNRVQELQQNQGARWKGLGGEAQRGAQLWGLVVAQAFVAGGGRHCILDSRFIAIVCLLGEASELGSERARNGHDRLATQLASRVYELLILSNAGST